MTTKKRVRGKRVHLELDQELAQAIEDSSKQFRLKQPDFMRWLLAQQLIGTHSLTAIAAENWP